jgi:protein-disulfide isomerase
LAPLLEQVLEKNPKTVKIVFKNFPIRSHRFAVSAALAALAAGRQGKFWEFHDELFKNHNQLDEEKFQQIADGLKLDKDQFEKDRQDPLLLEIVKHDFNQGIEAGVNSVPTVFVNGRRLKQRSLDGFQKLIDKELKNIKISSP